MRLFSLLLLQIISRECFGRLRMPSPATTSSWSRAVASFTAGLAISAGSVHASMLTLPLPVPLKNQVIFVRAGESLRDEQGIVETNPVKKLSTANALTPKGREQAVAAARELERIDLAPTFIFTSNTERAYETATIIARELRIGQNRIVPEFSFLDARALGEYEGTDSKTALALVHANDEKFGPAYKGGRAVDPTTVSAETTTEATDPASVPVEVPTDSINDVLVRGRQLLSTFESLYSGEQVLVVSPDSEILSILSAALTSPDPDQALPTHFKKFPFANGQVRRLDPIVVAVETLPTGQTQDEADVNNRLMRALRVRGSVPAVTEEVPPDWWKLYSIAVDNALGS